MWHCTSFDHSSPCLATLVVPVYYQPVTCYSVPRSPASYKHILLYTTPSASYDSQQPYHTSTRQQPNRPSLFSNAEAPTRALSYNITLTLRIQGQYPSPKHLGDLSVSAPREDSTPLPLCLSHVRKPESSAVVGLGMENGFARIQHLCTRI